MKFVYFGSAKFSCIILESLYLEGYKPSLVISQPDRPKGRGRKVLPTEVSLFAKDKGLSLIKPESLKTSQIVEKLNDQEALFFIVADYGKILPSSILSIPKVFTVGVHPSLLPFYRGAAPINWAIINGDKETAVTIFKVDVKMDAGEVIVSRKVVIADNDNALSLTEELAKIGAKSLIQVLGEVEAGKYNLSPQDEKNVTFARKLSKNDGRIDWKNSAGNIRNLIRGVWGWPGAYTYYKDKVIKVIESQSNDNESNQEPSRIIKIDKGGIYVATGKGVLILKVLKPEGKKEMDANAFICGYRIKTGDKFI
ncbi:MAG: methionyl-tRNA formyltransferase [Candidatus Omnitrophota bacterium]|nr:methionyl-tRNA formyltransferase [Candidatus Omnitrophota bacterium]